MKTKLLFLIFFFACFFYSNDIFSQGAYRDVVKLKNGSIIKGMVIQVENPENIGIKTSDGSLFVFSRDEVETIEKEEVTLYRERPYMDFSPKKKEPALAFLCSFLMPGGGQYYNGQYVKGGVMTGVWLSSMAMIIAGAKETEYYDGYYYHYDNHDDDLLAAGWVIYLGVYLWSMIDAPIVSKKINKLTQIKLNENSNLSISPHYSMGQDLYKFNIKPNPSIGMKLTLNL